MKRIFFISFVILCFSAGFVSAEVYVRARIGENRTYAVSNSAKVMNQKLVVPYAVQGAEVEPEGVEDYNKLIAKHLFKLSDKKNMDSDGFLRISSTSTPRNLLVSSGDKFKVILPTEDGKSWQYEIKSEAIVFLEKKVMDKETIFYFETIGKGKSKIYFDCLKKNEAVEARSVFVIVSK